MTINHYRVLGVAKDATQDQIRAAYKKKALQYHPDRNLHDSEKEKREKEKMFKLVNEAHQVLGNAESRKKHDAELAVAERRYYGSKPQPVRSQPVATKPQPPVNEQKKRSTHTANLFSRPSTTRQEHQRRQIVFLMVHARIEPEVMIEVIRLLMLAQQIQRLQQQMLLRQQRAMFDQGHHENPFRTRLRR